MCSLGTLALYEEGPIGGSGIYHTTDGDALVPAEKPISLQRMLRKSIFDFIKPLATPKTYANYNLNHSRKKSDEDDADSWKPLRKLYYEDSTTL